MSYNIDGKNYTKEQLQTMIDFYNHVETLPMDTKHEILKYLPYYRTLDKYLYKDTNAYDERFCSQPISFKEFDKYIIGEKNPHAYIFTPKENELMVIKVTESVYLYRFRIVNNKWMVGMVTQSYKSFKNNINLYINNNTYYDMINSYYILQARDCQRGNYLETQLLKDIEQFSDDIVTINNKTFLYNIEKYIYHYVSTGNKFNLNDLSMIEDLTFNQNGLPNKNIDYHIYDIAYDEFLKSLLRQIKFL